jgi:hypothetical protein
MSKYATLLTQDNKELEAQKVPHKVAQAQNQANAALLSKREALATAEIELIKAEAQYPFNMDAVIRNADTIDGLKRDIVIAEKVITDLFSETAAA